MAAGGRGPGQPFRAIYGGLVGLLSTLMSIGGGVFITALMTFYGQPIQRAVATASGFGPLISIPGALGFVWAGWRRRSAAGLARLRRPARRDADHPDQRAAAPLGGPARPWHLGPQARAGVRAFLLTVALRFLLSLSTELTDSFGSAPAGPRAERRR